MNDVRDAREAVAHDLRRVRNDRWLFALIFAVALVLRVVATVQYQAHHPHAEHPVIDEASYDRWAREIAGGEWLGHEVFFQEPLYPYTLGVVYALFGPERIVARLAQCLLGAAATVLAGWLARRAFGRAAGFVAAAASAVYWPGLLFPPLLLKENVFVPSFAAFALVLVSTRHARRPALAWFIAGVLAALGALLRGNMLVLLPVFVLWPVGRALVARRAARKSLTLAASAALGMTCVLVPVAWRNLHVGGVFALTTSGAGTNLYGGNNLENPYGRATEFSFIRGIPEYEAGDWRREAERRTGAKLDAAQVSDFWKGEVWRSVREHPGQHAAILWNKVRLTLGAYEVPDNHSLDWDARYVPIARLPWPGFGVVGVLGLAGCLLWFLQRVRRMPFASFEPGDPHAALDVALLFGLYLGTIVLTVTSDRARLPLFVLLAPFAGYAIAWCARALSLRSASAISAGFIALGVGALVVHVPVLTPAEIAEDHDERDYNLAVQWLRDEEHGDEVRAMASDLAQRHPRSARMQLLAAEVDYRRARSLLHAADATTQRAGAQQVQDVLARVDRLAEEPTLNARERFRAQSQLAWIRLAQGDWFGAEHRFREARAFDDDNRELKRGLVRALLGVGDDPSNPATLEKTGEALRLLDELAQDTVAPDDRDELTVLTAQARFQRGRVQLAGVNAEARELGRAAIQQALRELQPVAGSLTASAPNRQRARAVAGWIQLSLGNARAAANHFRAAQSLGSDATVDVGLLQALISDAERASPSAERSREIHEAEQILAQLASLESASTQIDALKQRLAVLPR